MALERILKFFWELPKESELFSLHESGLDTGTWASEYILYQKVTP